MLICGLGLLSFSCTFLSLLGTFVGLEQQIDLVSLLEFNLIRFLFESCNKHNSVAPCKNNNHGPESALSAATIIDTTLIRHESSLMQSVGNTHESCHTNA